MIYHSQQEAERVLASLNQVQSMIGREAMRIAADAQEKVKALEKNRSSYVLTPNMGPTTSELKQELNVQDERRLRVGDI